MNSEWFFLGPSHLWQLDWDCNNEFSINGWIFSTLQGIGVPLNLINMCFMSLAVFLSQFHIWLFCAFWIVEENCSLFSCVDWLVLTFFLNRASQICRTQCHGKHGRADYENYCFMYGSLCMVNPTYSCQLVVVSFWS